MGISNLVRDLRSGAYTQGSLTLGYRKKKLSLLKEVILKREGDIEKALRLDLGKSSFESYLTEIGFILEEIRQTLKKIDSWTKDRKVKTPLNLFPARSFIRPEPYGVVLIISPWNYPFQLCLSPFIGALAAGNRIVVKPSEFAPHTSSIIEKILNEVFQGENVAVVEGGVEETQILLKQHFDYIFFTGSTVVGKVIMKSAAEFLTPVTLELGGKSPVLIEESAELDLAAKRCAWGKFLNAGQTCIAPDYVLIPEKLQDQFIERMRAHLKIFFGEDSSQSSDYPRIINEKHFDRLKKLLVPEKIVIGGQLDREKKFITPTVMKNVDWSDSIMREEIFGPILPIIPYRNLEEAIFQIQKRDKPLAFYLFSRNQQKSDEILNQLPFGGGCVNDTIMHIGNPYLPFGGVGTSGMGSYHGLKSFETFSHLKSILVQKAKMDIPLRYPPYSGKLRWIRMFFR